MTFDLQAHRGGAGLWPENTLEAFGRALALGVSTLELDVHLTAEDDVVVAHDPAYRPFVTAAMVDEAHAAGLGVIPYVVDDEPTLRHLVRLGVDGLITNRPERLRDVLEREGRALPPAFPGG